MHVQITSVALRLRPQVHHPTSCDDYLTSIVNCLGVHEDDCFFLFYAVFVLYTPFLVFGMTHDFPPSLTRVILHAKL